MLFITQLVYIVEGQEAIFNEFEDHALPIIPRYNGQLLLRIRPDEKSVIDGSIERPYEIHLVGFEREKDLEAFMNDKERNQFLHLKDQSIRSVLLIKGERFGV